MKTAEIQKLIDTLDDASLSDVRDAVNAAVEQRRPKPTLETIRVGMTKDEEAAVRAEIARVLRKQ